MANIENTTTENAQDAIKIQDLFYLFLSKWPWFVISLAVCLGIAVTYLIITQPVYTRTASILIKDDSKGSSATAGMEAFADLGLFATNTNVNNEMGTLESPDLMREVVSRLHLETDYHVNESFRRQTIYGNQLPIRVFFTDLPENETATFTLQLSADGSVFLSEFERVIEGERVKLDNEVTGILNQPLSSPLGEILVIPTSFFTEGTEAEIYVSHRSLRDVVDDYVKQLTVSQNDDKSNIIVLSFKDVSPQRAEDLLNTLISVYNESWVKDKNRVAVGTSMFINERLEMIEGELGNVDDDISSFKSENLLPDVQAMASLYITQANEANISIEALNNQLYMARYVMSYLTDEENKFQLLPANSGIENQNLAAQISEYNDLLLERNSLVNQSSTRNPLVMEMDAALSGMRSALASSMDNQIVALNEQIRSQQSLGGLATSQISSNPEQAKYLLSVERQQKVKEALYLYLLQKREENELSQAFTAYNTRIITMPGGSMIPTSPVKRNILLMAFLLGLLIPGVIIFVQENMNTVVRGRKDLEGLPIPFIGEIPLAFRKKGKLFSRKPKEEKYVVVVKEKSRNVINEAFRVVRTNLEFMLGKGKSNVIMFTSINPGSGKSFICYNLSTSYAIKGKRVLALDLDLRKGSLSEFVGQPEIGISNYLAGETDTIQDILFKSFDNERLDIIPIGKIPPNPTELLFTERLEQLIEFGRQNYDLVFIDCPPVEIVADATIINKLVDTTLFVIRVGLLDRAMLPEIKQFYLDKKFNNMSLILNGTENSGGRYGAKYKYKYKYGYRYGYKYGYGYSGYTEDY
ncbi:MAG: polysaccharide biosynthesis tyrosine autokinase [Rikenellaceae bacterium]|jgi:capsular exopolysaccharide synthesis family protein|nr:polysaccharide biosynthesis tyrosine autokinase [Rikenellaceae bacterium]